MIDLEAQIRRARTADIWINGGGWKTLPAMLEDEPRYAEFEAHRRGRVWGYERRLTPAGGNDYWSRSITRPDIVLADIVEDLSPGAGAGARLRMVHAGSGAVRRMSVVLQAHRTRTVTGRLTREACALAALVILLVVVFVASLVLGSTWIPVSRVIDVLFAGAVDRDAAAIVVETVRLPRSFTAMLSGAALGIAGLQMQTLFRNPLADPFVLGSLPAPVWEWPCLSLAPATGRLPRSAPHWACGATRLLSWRRSSGP